MFKAKRFRLSVDFSLVVVRGTGSALCTTSTTSIAQQLLQHSGGILQVVNYVVGAWFSGVRGSQVVAR